MPQFRRSLGTRILSAGSLLLFSILEAGHLAGGGALLSPGGLLLAALVLLGLAACLLNLGDRFQIDDAGIVYSNPLLARLGLSRGRRVAWREVTSCRAHHPLRQGEPAERASALFLRLSDGRRLVLDSLENFDEVHRLVAARVGSGDAGPVRSGGDPAGGGRSGWEDR